MTVAVSELITVSQKFWSRCTGPVRRTGVFCLLGFGLDDRDVDS